MRALVTGASGFIGAHVARALATDGAEVRAFGRCCPPPEAGDVEHVRGDVRDPRALARAIAGCDAVFHLAAAYSYSRRDARRMEQVNVEGTRLVLDAAARAGVRRVVLTSSSATCGPVAGRAATEADGPPEWELVVPYKRTKLAAERAALAAAADALDVVVVNPTSVVGPGDRRPTPTGRMVADVVRGRIGAYIPRAGLNVVAVEDVARGHLLAYERGRRGERYILGGQDLPLGEAFAVAARAVGRRPPRWRVPYPGVLAAAHAASACGRLLRREPALLNLDEVRLARLPMWFSSAKAEAELGYAWRPAEEALEAAAGWFAAHAGTPRRTRARRRLAPSRRRPARTAS